MATAYRTGYTVKGGPHKGKRRCEKWVEHRLARAQRGIDALIDRRACSSSLCDTRLEHAQADLREAWKDLKAKECDKVIVTLEHLDLIMRKTR